MLLVVLSIFELDPINSDQCYVAEGDALATTVRAVPM